MQCHLTYHNASNASLPCCGVLPCVAVCCLMMQHEMHVLCYLILIDFCFVLHSQVGYWKDLLEIAVRMCVSPEALQQRAQKGVARKQQISDRMYEIKMNVKFPVSCWFVL